MEVPDPGGWYIDEGLGRNNPSEVTLSEARKYWTTFRLFCLVSIGTGIQKTADFIEVSISSGHMGREDSDVNKEARHSTSAGTFKGFKGAAGIAISSFLVNIETAPSKMPLASNAIDLSRVLGGITLKRFVQELVKLSIESEDTHIRIWGLVNNPHDEFSRFPYFRFNVSAGMKDIDREEWNKITKWEP